MSIRIDQKKCVGCRKCSEVCPGTLIVMEGKKAVMKYPKNCWGCVSCVKECKATGIIPEVYTIPFTSIACEYGPIAAGAFSVAITFFMSRSFFLYLNNNYSRCSPNLHANMRFFWLLA